jgi:hypothetical protein
MTPTTTAQAITDSHVPKDFKEARFLVIAWSDFMTVILILAGERFEFASIYGWPDVAA